MISSRRWLSRPFVGARQPFRLRTSELERRLLLAADISTPVVTSPTPAAGTLPAESVVAAANIVFIDQAVESIDQLSDAVLSDSEIVLLRADQDGVDQISKYLAGRSDVHSVHLVAHGAAGRLQLGNSVVDINTLEQRSEQIRAWSKSLASDADVLLYGCDTGQGVRGQEFLATLAELTGADIAASIDTTGQGGDWELEREIGVIQASLAFDATKLSRYRAHLPITISAAGAENTEQMQLLIDNNVVQTWDNIGGDAGERIYQDYTYNVDGISVDRVRVAFTNDFLDESNGIDRNLRVDKITVDGVEYQTEAPTVFSTGTWLPADGIQPGYRQSEYLHTDGYLQYAESSANGSLIQVTASGDTGDESMELLIDGERVAAWDDVSTNEQTYTYQASETITPDRVRVAFTNDLYDEAAGIDRNLNVDKIQIDGTTFESEGPNVFSTGSWLPGDGITPGFGRSDTLNSDGYFQYGNVDLDPSPDPGSIVIFAAGTTGTETLELQIDGTTVATFESIGGDEDSGSFQRLDYQAAGAISASQVRVVFVNDLYDEAAGVDRNLVVDKIAIDGVEYETEAPDVFSTGTWLPADGIVPGFRQSETLHSNGYFQYAGDTLQRGFIGLGGTQFTVDETDGFVEIPLIRYEGSEGAATVFLQSLAVSATDGEDFIGTDSLRVDFADGQTVATAVLNLLDDGDAESIETFSVSLFRAEAAELGVPRTAIVTIVDDESGADLVGRWRLDENSLAVPVADSSASGNAGVFRNFGSGSGPQSDAPNVDSLNSGSVRFDGVNDYIAVASDPSLNLSGGAFTQSVWINPSGGASGYQGVLGYQGGLATNQRYPGIWVYQGDRIHAGFGDGANWNSFLTGSVLTQGEWNHLATTFDGTTYRAFVNGSQVFATDAFAGRTPTNTQQLDIGRVDNYFSGGIDDVQIYSRALTPSEIGVLIDGADLPSLPVDGEFIAQSLYSGFDTPLAVDWLPGGDMLVAEQAGRVIRIAADGTRQSTPLLDITDRVNSGTKDRGMLGFAVHPDFDNNPYIYVSYTYDPPEVYQHSGLGGPDGNGARVARISRFTVDASGTFANPDSEFVLVGNNSIYDNIGNPDIRPGLDDPHSCFDANGNPLEDCIAADETSHTIGDLEFGPDGSLYASSGDGGSFGRVDPVNLRALDLDSLSGKVLRINPITGQGYTDNPFYDGDLDSNQSKVYQYGLRNPFRLAVNQQTGDVYSGDVGWTQWEEINVGRGANFGWPAFEGGINGSLRTNGYRDLAEVQAYYATNPDVTAPAWARLHSDGARAIVMGDFISGAVYPTQYQDALLFTDIGDQVLRVATFDSSGNIDNVQVVSSNLGFLVDVQLAADGFLYYVDITGSVGRLNFQLA
ncbi:carbohydrate-binding domain-containing protein [Stieleria varia]|uniref:Quinoprotein glucose dehydrogenase B n=1 Tax=Stieleria varia TaxID=2528005 RepID=A0A5C6ANS1_9BACT|nr:carbohydrate-binding domain-containing protein [Stieleria varia]TWU01330.1 Quinoprotein glucose dehydrogenase B precursor [Stieleria varia]